MKRASILIASRRKKVVREKPSEDGEEEWAFDDDLLKPEQVVIVDDANSYQLFGDSIFCAPQEDILEGRPSHLRGLFLTDSCWNRFLSSAWLSSP